jgi:hypothetical protein
MKKFFLMSFLIIDLILINNLIFANDGSDKINNTNISSKKNTELPSYYEIHIKLIKFKNEKKFKEAETYLLSIIDKTNDIKQRFKYYNLLLSNYAFEENFIEVVSLGNEMIDIFYKSTILGEKIPVALDSDFMASFIMVIFSYRKLNLEIQAKIATEKSRFIIRYYGGDVNHFESLLKIKPYIFNKDKKADGEGLFSPIKRKKE